MQDVTTNVGIYFTDADSMLKEDGEIKVYDEDTGILLATFTKANWNKYIAFIGCNIDTMRNFCIYKPVSQ